jgi:hypothetical protein
LPTNHLREVLKLASKIELALSEVSPGVLLEVQL